jgi:hypothetical protein
VEREHADEVEPPRPWIALGEIALLLGIPAVYYWNTREENEHDFDLEWDWESWRRKLTFDAVRFDTNTFRLNAVRHPLVSVIAYDIGRTNGFGMLGSTLLSVGYGVVWEYFIEYREYPSINDLIVHTVVGLEVGEPLWQIGQLWRGGVLSVGDRVKTTLFSPLDGVQDMLRRKHFLFHRLRAWRSMVFDGGVAHRRFDGPEALDDDSYNELVVMGDVDIVRDRRYLLPGPQRGAIKPGTWSRIMGRIRAGQVGDDTDLTGTQLQSRTAIAGIYRNDGDGDASFLGLGTAFTYRRDRLPEDWDHVGIAHILGPQLQLSRRRPSYAVRWDAAVYGDFAMIDAFVFAPENPFPRPPPYISKLQVNGYYDAAGVTGTTRLRIDTPAWMFDAEVEGHHEWQIDAAQRVQPSESAMANTWTAHDVSDTRVYWRARLAWQPRRIGIAVATDGAYRRGDWRTRSRSATELGFSLLAQLDL